MKTVLIANYKGGVGKTLLADELLWKFEKDKIRASFANLDPQGSSYHQSVDDPEAQVCVIDTAGHLTTNLKELIEKADFIVIPTMMSARDKEPLENMISFVQPYLKTKPVLFVFNRWDRFNFTKEFIGYFNTAYPDIKTTILANTVAFNQASAYGMSLEEYQPTNPACKHIDHIYSSIKYELNIKDWRLV